MGRLLVEVCVESLAAARCAVEAGADRLELNSALEAGGLTPTIGLLEAVRRAVDVPLVVMLRPRAGGFLYDRDEIETVMKDAAHLRSAGADAFAFGALRADRTLDVECCREVATSFAGAEFVLHRAFDLVDEKAAALESAVELGCTRILTSGGAATALEGAATIANLLARANGRLGILPGAGINSRNVADLVARTGCTEVHGSFSSDETDHASARGSVSFAARRRGPDRTEIESIPR